MQDRDGTPEATCRPTSQMYVSPAAKRPAAAVVDGLSCVAIVTSVMHSVSYNPLAHDIANQGI